MGGTNQPGGGASDSNHSFVGPNVSNVAGRAAAKVDNDDDISIDSKYRACAGTRTARTLPDDKTITKCIDEAARVLPTQGTLDRFVHQNPYMHFEDMPFDAALSHVHHLLDYLSPAERFARAKFFDPRPRVNEAIYDLCASFIDVGSARWEMPQRDRGFLYNFALLEGLGLAPWRSGARQQAARILQDFGAVAPSKLDPECEAQHRAIADKYILEHLYTLDVPRDEWTAVMRAYLSEVPGWAGMFKFMEETPAAGPYHSHVRLCDLLAVRMILIASSMGTLSCCLCMSPSSVTFPALVSATAHACKDHGRHPGDTQHHSRNSIYSEAMREGLERKYKQTLIEEMGQRPPEPVRGRPELQVWTCIDDRMEGLRRYIEEESSSAETLGVAGFFGVPHFYEPMDGHKSMLLAPVGNVPTGITVVEKSRPGEEGAMKSYLSRRRILGSLTSNIEYLCMNPFLSLLGCGLIAPLAAVRLALRAAPVTEQLVYGAFNKVFVPPKPSPTFDLPWPVETAAKLLGTCLLDIGTSKNFAPIVVLLGHGSDSTNNPFWAAHNCGACSGQHGDNNARLFARAANNREVRALLKSQHGISIPADTHFVSGGVNSASSRLHFFDLDEVPDGLKDKFLQARKVIDAGNAKNCLQRVNHFFLDKHNVTPEQAMKALDVHATDLAEIRPELSHSTNASVIVGRRGLTKDRNLDCRAFLLSYDPFQDDATGTSLQRILTPGLVVGSGINLEYLFSLYEHGAGTKVPLNIVSNIGVMQGTIGDLKPGLPCQMTEMHIPTRATYVVDAPVSRVEAVLSRNIVLERLVRNEWVIMIVRDPNTNTYYELSGPSGKGKFVPMKPFATPFQQPNGFKDGYDKHKKHGYAVKLWEDMIWLMAILGIISACLVPILVNSRAIEYSRGQLNEEEQRTVRFGVTIATVATFLSIPMLAFSRKYLHGEYMLCRYTVLFYFFVFGFNWVVTSPNPTRMGPGYSLLGFCSTFLIALYNERPSVSANATFVFAMYKAGDLCMLLAAASYHAVEIHHLKAMDGDGLLAHPISADPGMLLALGLIGSAYFKSSQFPITSLFAQSMEGPTPSTGLGYTGLSAHMGVTMLAISMPHWFPYTWARIAVGVWGGFTAIYASSIAQTLSDRKGPIAYMAAASIGQLFVILAIGWWEAALLLAIAHALYRINQILLVPGTIKDSKNLKASLIGTKPFLTPWQPTQWLYKFAWMCRRFDRDIMELPRWLSPADTKMYGLPGPVQVLITFLVCVFGAAPDIFPTFIPGLEQRMLNWMVDNPGDAVAVFVCHALVSVGLIRWLFHYVLDPIRFRQNLGVEDMPRAMHGMSEAAPSSSNTPKQVPMMPTGTPYFHHPAPGAVYVAGTWPGHMHVAQQYFQVPGPMPGYPASSMLMQMGAGVPTVAKPK